MSEWCVATGEGTWYQLQRMAACAIPVPAAAASTGHREAVQREAIGAVAVSLGVIWISHPHADHHLGIVRLTNADLDAILLAYCLLLRLRSA
jgi:hypothetical protein